MSLQTVSSLLIWELCGKVCVLLSPTCVRLYRNYCTLFAVTTHGIVSSSLRLLCSPKSWNVQKTKILPNVKEN